MDEISLEKWYALSLPDKSFLSDFEKEFPSEYYEMLQTLQRGNVWEGLARGVWGFHFSPKLLEVVSPQKGKFYFFPQRPTPSQMNGIAELSLKASGWNNRSESVLRLHQSMIVKCYGISPTPETEDQTVVVKPNVVYRNLMGVEIVADNSLQWSVRGTKSIVIEDK